MKKILLIIVLFVSAFSNAQIVNIPDTNFKNALLSANTLNLIARDTNYNWTTIDTNNDGEIQESEAQNIAYLYINDRFISSLDGIDKFTNLLYLDCTANSISNLDLTSNTSLDVLRASNNNISFLNIASNIYLKELFCANNSLTSIDVSSNTELSKLFCNNNGLTNLNLSSNLDLTNLDCSSNTISTLNVDLNTELTNFNYANNANTGSINISTLTNLITFNCEQNSMNTLDITNNIELRYLFCSSNILNSLDCSFNINLINLACDNNNFTELDLSSNPSLNQLKCGNNTALDYINLKNGNNDSFVFGNFSDFEVLPNLNTVCVDELNSSLTTFINSETLGTIVYTEYCSLNPANNNEINGVVKFDENLDGCNSSNIAIPNKLISTSNGTDSFGTFTQQNGSYLLYTNDGYFSTSLTTTLPNYVDVTPSSQANNFVGFGNMFTANFCIAPNQVGNDVSISLIPLNQARPGFNALYRIVYSNNGTAQVNGSISLVFDDSKLNFSTANPEEDSIAGNVLTFDYENLNPFETRTIDLVLNVFTSPTVNIDDELEFTASINPTSGDSSPSNNIFVLNQTVVGSYDPNDIHVLEGSQIMFTKKDESLHYVIRFQNTGTADAINVVVKNVLDSNLDWSTLELETTSHQSRVAIKNENEIEFIFENIHLPDSTTDEPNSHGFIAYKIKPISSIAVDQLIPNKVDIFFDLNEAIETNTASTKYVNTLTIVENNLLKFTVYPSPTKNILHIEAKNNIETIEICNHLGQLVLKATNQNTIDVSNLITGFYFVRIKDENGNSGVKKIIKQ